MTGTRDLGDYAAVKPNLTANLRATAFDSRRSKPRISRHSRPTGSRRRPPVAFVSAPTLRQTRRRDLPTPQFAFRRSTFNVFCNSHYFSHLAASFIDSPPSDPPSRVVQTTRAGRQLADHIEADARADCAPTPQFAFRRSTFTCVLQFTFHNCRWSALRTAASFIDSRAALHRCSTARVVRQPISNQPSTSISQLKTCRVRHTASDEEPSRYSVPAFIIENVSFQ